MAFLPKTDAEKNGLLRAHGLRYANGTGLCFKGSLPGIGKPGILQEGLVGERHEKGDYILTLLRR